MFMRYKHNYSYFLIPIISLLLSQSISYFNQSGLNLVPEFIIMIPINYLLWLCLYVLCFSLFHKAYKSFFLYLFILTFFILINHYKIKFLHQVFVVTDLLQVKNLVSFFPNFINQPRVVIVLISTITSLSIGYLFLKKYFHQKNSKINRLVFLPISLFIPLIPFFFASQYNYFIQSKELPITRTNSIENCKKNGIIFCFFDDLKNFKTKTPKKYSKESVEKIFSESKNQEEKTSLSFEKPNIILILSEALFDATKLTNVKFDQDPIENIRTDIKSTLISPQLGGGTANVEFEVLTGLSNYFYDNTVPYSQLIRNNIPSLFTLFKEQGYQTTVIHPYFRYMYNRTVVYNYFGLDKFISIEDMSNYQKAGSYVSDRSFVNEILKEYNSTENPQFIFGLSMQNHYPFEPNRFLNHEVNFSDNLPTFEHQVLQSYVDGIFFSDQSYQFLKENILKSNKPTIVIYFGDHLPLLTTKGDIFNLLGYFTNEPIYWSDDENYKMHTTPIALYSNFSTSLDIIKQLSPNFLSLEILKLANINPKYQFSFLNSLSDTDTVLTKQFSPNFTQKQLDNYSVVQYDVVSGKQYLLNLKETTKLSTF